MRRTLSFLAVGVALGNPPAAAQNPDVRIVVRDTVKTVTPHAYQGRNRNSGPEQFYELTVKRAAPDWRASLAASSLVAKPGTTNELKLTFTRLCGLTNAYQIVVPKLPEGVTCEPMMVPEAGGEVKLNVMAAETAAAWRGPIQVMARNPSNGVERVIPFKLTATTTDNGVPGGYRVLLADEIAHAWLTVLPKAEKKEEKKAESAK